MYVCLRALEISRCVWVYFCISSPECHVLCLNSKFFFLRLCSMRWYIFKYIYISLFPALEIFVSLDI